MNANEDLLSLRLAALKLDVEKVRFAVARALDRSRDLNDANDNLQFCLPKLHAVERWHGGLAQALDDDDVFEDLIARKELGTRRDLLELASKLGVAIKSVRLATASLKHAVATLTPIESGFGGSLDVRCTSLKTQISALQKLVLDSPAADRRDQWRRYKSLLDTVARPVFTEYVDFLGGLTLRDTGLDDRVCEMTDALLKRFITITPRTQSLPLPARQAALGNALDGLVMLGFPEWSIWGIPLVAHEIGLGYSKTPLNADGLALIIDRFVDRTPKFDEAEGADRGHAEEYLAQLLADALGTYILGFAYACAALLLRLDPRHDEPKTPTRPRDIDRARVIMMTLEVAGASEGGTSGEAVDKLKELWESAVTAHAGPAEADAALAEATGPPAEEDWLDDFTVLAVEHFTDLTGIRLYDDERWAASKNWRETLLNNMNSEKQQALDWSEPGDAVCDVLNAAWYLRLIDGVAPDPLAKQLISSWSGPRKKG